MIALIYGEQPVAEELAPGDHLEERVAVLRRETLCDGRDLVEFPLDARLIRRMG